MIRDFLRKYFQGPPGPPSTINFAPVVVELSKLTVQPGDVVMLQFARPINDRVFAAIKEQAKPLFPDNKIMVVEGDIELKVLRSDKCAAEG